MTYKYFSDAIDWFDKLDTQEKNRIKSECPDSWKSSMVDFYEWVADEYKKQIEDFNGKK